MILNIRIEDGNVSASLRATTEMIDSADNLHNIGEAVPINLPSSLIEALENVIKENTPVAERKLRRQAMRHMTTIEDRLEQPVNADSSERAES